MAELVSEMPKAYYLSDATYIERDGKILPLNVSLAAAGIATIETERANIITAITTSTSEILQALASPSPPTWDSRAAPSPADGIGHGRRRAARRSGLASSRYQRDGSMCPMAVKLERFWKAVNPLTRPIAGYVPWWVLVETTGRCTGRRRLTPLANAPFHGATLSVLSVYGNSAAFVKNIRANPVVRIKRRGRWLDGTAEVVDPTPDNVARLGVYARRALLRFGSDSKVVRVTVA